MKKFLLSIGVLMALTCSTVIPASADNAAGSGSGHTGGGGAGVWAWSSGQSTTLPTQSSAWKTFKSHIQYNSQKTDSGIMSSAGLSQSKLNVCKTSAYVWWYAKDSTTKHWSTYGGYNIAGDNPSGKAAAVFKNFPGGLTLYNWARVQPGWNSKINLVCSNMSPAFQWTKKTKTTTEYDYGSDPIKATFSGVYQSQTTLTPEKPYSYNKWAKAKKDAWNNSHESQSTGQSKNNWSKWIDTLKNISISAGSHNGQQQVDNLVNKSKQLQKGDYVAHPTIKLSNKNRKGFAKGGVITVAELRKTATVSYIGSQGKTRSRKVITTWEENSNGQKRNVKKTYGKWSAWAYKKATITVHNAKANSLTPYSYWQMINVICNANGFNQVKKAISGFKTLSMGNGNGSSAGYTPTYMYGSGSTPYAKRPLGNSAQANKVLKDTAYDGFYMKVGSCSGNTSTIVEPTTKPTNPSTTPDTPVSSGNYVLNCANSKQVGATNDSANNVLNKNSDGNHYGSQTAIKDTESTVGYKANDSFTFYRDNRIDKVRNDLWYPVIKSTQTNTKVNAFSKEQPVLTDLAVATDGSPRGDMFGLRLSNNGDDIINGNGGAYSSNEPINTLFVHAKWVSNKDQKISQAWTWTPTVANNVLTTVSGNGGSAHQTTATDNYAKIAATCSLKMNSMNSGNDTLTVINTGFTGQDPTEHSYSYDKANNHHVSIGFVRSTADAQ